MRKYGEYENRANHYPGEISGNQSLLPAGVRIRNKKAKRRVFKKKRRNTLKAETSKSLAEEGLG